ncbi:MAG: ATP phosphoribosyltransferase regulatory subunit [Firmicutes bacterium]|nr:ATP phosphoribosyltransferase regulatory subunit [Bacillota bacterium]
MDIDKNRITPGGTKDYIYEECAKRRECEDLVRAILTSFNYREVYTPTLEYLDVFSSGVGKINADTVYTLSGNDGKLLALRPDSTKPISRLYSSRLRGEKLPLRLFYNQSVFKRNLDYYKKANEIRQIGAELLGQDGESADMEMLTVALKSMKALFGNNFALEIGHMGFMRSILNGLSGEYKERAKIAISAKNYPEILRLADELSLLKGGKQEALVDLLRKLPKLFGDSEVLSKAESLKVSAEASEAIKELKDIYKKLKKEGLSDNVIIDLTVVNDYDYYTGVVIKGFVTGEGAEVLSGGRYNTLYGDYNLNVPATGFAIDLNAVARILLNTKKSDSKKLTLVLTKGRIQNEIAKRFKAIGIDMPTSKDETRKLIFEFDNFRVVYAKSNDVVTFVEHGVADAGIVGKDTLLESEIERGVYEILDLGLANCRFALAGLKGADVLSGCDIKTIATKYPVVTKRYFGKKMMDVEIVKIEGSVELAPILGLADAIVDLVESGRTLEENGLEVKEEIHQISARLIVNPVSLKLKKKEIEELVRRLSNDKNN